MADLLRGRVDERARTGRRRGMAGTGLEAGGVFTSPARSRVVGSQTGSAPAADRARPSTASRRKHMSGKKSRTWRPQETMLGRVVSRHSPAMLTKQSAQRGPSMLAKQFAQHNRELDEMAAEGGRRQQQAQASFIEAARDPGRHAPYQPPKRIPRIAAPKVAEQPFLEQVEPAAGERFRVSSRRRGK